MQGIDILFMTIAASSLIFAQNTYEKALDVNGSAYCATDKPSDIFQVSNTTSKFGCVPLSAQCALLCEMNSNCATFNVKNAAGQCEFYNSLPTLCSIVPDCIHFKVKGQVCSNPGCSLGEKVVNYTLSGVQVPLLYFNNSFVIMQRLQGTENFNRSFEDYKTGFGDIGGCDFWIGTEMMHLLTTKNGISFRLHVEVQTYTDRKWFYADYSTFWIDSEQDNYKLHVGGYSGDAGDSLTYAGGYTGKTDKGNFNHNGQMFSTPDRPTSCAAKYSSGWWFNYCWWSCLTCIYTDISFSWYSLTGTEYYGKLRRARMTIRPNVTLKIND